MDDRELVLEAKRVIENEGITDENCAAALRILIDKQRAEKGWRMAKHIQVVRDPGGAAKCYIDGEMFPFYTTNGFTVHSERKHAPEVTFTVVAEGVELRDHLFVREVTEDGG
jgi:hypothetical protein